MCNYKSNIGILTFYIRTPIVSLFSNYNHNYFFGSSVTTERLKADEAIMSEISDLQKKLTFCNDKKLVLMISFALDEMIRETMKYPEVFLWTAQLELINRKENSSSQSFTLPLASVISRT